MVRSNLSVKLPRATNVLLIEDEVELAELLAAELEAAEIHVEHARNGRVAFEFLRDAIPDLIVSDVVMPEMDGHQFLERLRADPVLRQIPVIMLSNKRGVADIVASFKMGADDYITKPVDPAELVARVNSKIGRPTVPAEQMRQDRHSGLLSFNAFRHELKAEMQRATRVGYPLMVAAIGVPTSGESPPATQARLIRRVSASLAESSRPLDLLGRSAEGDFLLVMPETTASEAKRRLEQIVAKLTALARTMGDATGASAPAIGYARAALPENVDHFLNRVRAAKAHAETHSSAHPTRYKPAMLANAPMPAQPPLHLALLDRVGLLARDDMSGRGSLFPPNGETLAAAVPWTASVLLVEDDPALAERIRAELEGAGYRVEFAENGRVGLDHLNDATHDLIITDVMMPEMNGLEFMAALRADPNLADIPAIMLTTRRKVSEIIEGFDLGADDYLTKPVDPAELLARVHAKLKRPPVPAGLLHEDRQSGFLSPQAFATELAAELLRAERAGYPLTVVAIDFAERAPVRERLGAGADAPLALQVSTAVSAEARPVDVLGRSTDGGYLVLMPEMSEDAVKPLLERTMQRLIRRRYIVCGEALHLTPTVGFSTAEPGVDADEMLARIRVAREHSEGHLDLQPARYEPGMVMPPKEPLLPQSLRELLERLRFPLQIAASFVIGWLLPYLLYVSAASIGHDLTKAAYIVIVISLVMTCLMIWTEGFLALREEEPPDGENLTYPPASAIIAAYLPNEAATIISTLEAMLRIDYPGQLQIILAYNTPKDMPIERTLRDMAVKDPRLEVVRIVGSTSKAQNVNAGISYVKGEFTAIYDADHQPDPDSFTRAWRWLSGGADVVQGHCLIRNGDASWVARMVAVEFEQIYGVSHPGRARLSNFGIFGGSNGFWRTDLLRRIRMRGFMLTEDIDSSLRVVEEGGKIVVDRRLVSRELSPTSFKGLTHQRLRWAQGWYQVTKIRLSSALRSPHLSKRQKVGMFYLLAWREFFPWIAMQIVPIIAFWAVQAGSLAAIDWFLPLFLVITLFVLSTGPGQILFTYRVADPEIRDRRKWFVHYFFLSVFMYMEYKNILCRVANIKEWLKERAWKITPRS